jgi:hypothetical protein
LGPGIGGQYPPWKMIFTLLIMLSLGCAAASAGQDADVDRDVDDRLGLADLAAYRAALSGKATADDARPSDSPRSVGFRDLWERPEAYRGRRVTIRGRLERTFRQGAVGSFPPLVEAWIFSASGDPFCVVFPRLQTPAGGVSASGSAPGSDGDHGQDSRTAGPPIPGPGRLVRFTGTFLKTVRYGAGDGERLAPVIVGDRPPEHQPPAEAGGEARATRSGAGEILRAIGGGGRDDHPGTHRRTWKIGSWAVGLTLAALTALVIAGQHLRGARLRHRATAQRRPPDRDTPDPPLQFVDSPAEDRS